MIFKKSTIESLNNKLSLPFTGIEQDWDIEMADSARIEEFIAYYKSTPLNPEERVALMALILASYDDLLCKEQAISEHFWESIKPLIEVEKPLFSALLSYWAIVDEHEPDNIFHITPLVRAIR